MARVRSVIAASTASGEIWYVSGSTSTNTGTPLASTMADADATNVTAGTMTSSPGSMPTARKASSSAAVPVGTAAACFVPT